MKNILSFFVLCFFTSIVFCQTTGSINLNFAGQNNVRIGFKFTSTASSSVTWEINEVIIYK